MSTNDTVTKGIHRRNLLRGIGAVGTGLVLLGCEDSSGASGGRAEVLFWLPGGSDIFLKTHKSIAKAYSAKHQDVSVTVKRHTGQQDFMEVLLARIAAGNPPSGTVLWDTPVSLGVRGSLLPLDTYMAGSKNAQKKNWPTTLLRSCQFGGKTYGLPYQAGSYAMWYNQDWFEEKGIPSDPDSFPETWDDLRSLSKEFTRWDGDKLQTVGFLPPFLGDTAAEMPIWSALNGGQVFDAGNRRYTIDSDANVEMMEYFVSWLKEEYRGDIRKVQESGSWGAYEGDQGQPPAFQNKRLAVMLGGSWLMGDLYEFKPKFERWNIAFNPVGPGGDQTVSGYWPNWLGIPTGADNPDETFDYFDYLSVDGAIKLFAAVPDQPANKLVGKGIAASIVTQKRGREFAEQATEFFRHQLEISTAMWDSPVQSFAMDQLGSAIERIANLAARPRDALSEAQQACQSKLESTL